MRRKVWILKNQNKYGIAALIKSHNPKLTAIEIADILKISTTPIPELTGKVQSGGIIDAFLCLKESEKY